MMLDILRLLRDKRLCKALLGHPPQEFQLLSKEFGKRLHATRASRAKRERRVGGGRKGKLPTNEHKLAFVLIYLKTYPTFDVMGFLSGRARSKCCESIQTLLPVLEQLLGHACVLPARQIRSVDEFYRLFPGVTDVIVDGTERPTQRPKSPKRARKTYSGKKKRHSRKTIAFVETNKRIAVLTTAKSGRRHDKRLADKATLFDHIPEHVAVWGDTGFQGIQEKHPNSLIPDKARKRHPLTDEQKARNRVISSLRVIVEHAIGGMKRFKAAHDIYRNKLPSFDDKLNRVSAGLWNYHLQFETISRN